MPLSKLDKDKPLPIRQAFRHLIFLQIKLLFDAARDVFLSPISMLAFICDAIFRPKVKDSFSYRLILTGRKTDRIINLFGEYSDSDEFTIDETVTDLESALLSEINKRRAPENSSESSSSASD